jgi:CRP-like cAMP-binding protein
MNDKNRQFLELEEIGIGKKFLDQLCVMLESSYLFKDFSRNEIEQLVEYMHGYKAPKGAILFQEGERDSYLMIITSGKAQVLKDDGTGKMKEIATVRSGATLGEMSIIDDFPHSATVITTEDSEVALLTKVNLVNITEKFPALGVKLLWQIAWQLSARVRQASGKLVDHIN